MADNVLAIIESPAGEMFCPHCEHFIDWHRGLPWNGGPNREWRFRCRCGCTVDCPTKATIRLLDPDDFTPTLREPVTPLDIEGPPQFGRTPTAPNGSTGAGS